MIETPDRNGDVVIDIRDEKLVLLPERAVFWQRTATLLVADPHWGKAATFRASGIPVPSGTTREGIERLSSVVGRMAVQRVIFLGDLLHAREGRSADMFAALSQWRSANAQVDVVLVRGNHDRRAGDPPLDLCMECVDAPYLAEPFILAHHPAKSDDGYVFAGHVHPGIRLYGAGRQRERLPCFLFGQEFAVLPAFGDFTGLADVEPDDGESVYAIADDRVIRVY